MNSRILLIIMMYCVLLRDDTGMDGDKLWLNELKREENDFHLIQYEREIE